jgi:hypothetical protein
MSGCATVGLDAFKLGRGVRIGRKADRRNKQSRRGNHGQESHLEHTLRTHSTLLVV